MLHRSVVIMDNFLEKNSIMKRFVLLSFLLVYFAIHDSVFAKSDPVNHDYSYNDTSENFSRSLENILKMGVEKLDIPLSGGCIKVNSVYLTEKMDLVYVKDKSRYGADKKFYGEFEGLRALRETKTVMAPRPIATGLTIDKSNHLLVLEYLNLTSLNEKSTIKLGRQIADLHLFNFQQNTKPTIKKFGFHVETSCGKIPQNNKWTDDWITFFIENRLEHQIHLLSITRKGSAIKKVTEDYWPRLKPMIPKFFEGIDVKPSLLHGDLWSGNVAQVNRTEPVVFDPAAFYGHHEYDIAITTFIDGFKKVFYDEYFKKIPKAVGFEKRMILYHLYYQLNSWNQYGIVFKGSTINTFKELFNSTISN